MLTCWHFCSKARKRQRKLDPVFTLRSELRISRKKSDLTNEGRVSRKVIPDPGLVLLQLKVKL
jgi:hypothetical protein